MACLEGSHAGNVKPEMESTLVNRTTDSPAMGAHDVVLGSSTVELSKQQKKNAYQRAYRLRKQIERLEEEKRQLERERELVLDTILELYKPDYFCKHCRVELESNTMEGMCADCFWDTEKLHRGKPLQFTVYENNGELFPVSHMSAPEKYAIQCEVEAIVGDLDAFDVDLDYEEEVDYGVVKCSDPDRLMEFQGKTYRVQPKQYGLTPWGENVQIRFETILTKRNDDGCGCDGEWGGCGCVKLTSEEREKMLSAFNDDVLEGITDKELKEAYDALMKKRAGRTVHPRPKK